MKKILYFVDQKKRDLPGICLIAHLLKQQGIQCILEPIQAWRAAVALHKPDMVVLSNLFTDNMLKYSQKLRKIGVKICVLPNEGVLYHQDDRNYNAFKYHQQAAVDIYFSWNKELGNLVQQNLQANNPNLQVETVGCHRFDFNFAPLKPTRTTNKPTLLICTIFGYAHYYTKNKKEAEEWLAPFKDKVESLNDWWGVIETNYNARNRFLTYAEEVLKKTEFNIIIKPHPNETAKFYEKWIAQLPTKHKERISFAPHKYIWEVLNECDILISCETCTTSVEAWMINKPTLEFIFERKEPFYFHQLSQWNPQCSTIEDIAPMIEKVLAGTATTTAMKEGQQKHLKQWYSSPNGKVSQRIANKMVEITKTAKPNYNQLTISDKRRACKLFLNNLLGKQYGLTTLTRIKAKLMPKKYGNKLKVASRAVSQKEVTVWMNKIEKMLKKANII